MDPSQPAGSRRRTTAIIAAAGLACLAIAIPVSGAFGADDNGNNGAAAQSQQQGGQGYGQPPAPNGQHRPPEPGQRGLGQLRHGPPGRLARFLATKEPADVGVGRLLRARTGRCPP
jgi:hypothetical protein